MALSIIMAFTTAGLLLGLASAGMCLLWRGIHGAQFHRHACCGRCGYDLRGHNDLVPARCPECGLVLCGCGVIRIAGRRPLVCCIWLGLLLTILGAAPIIAAVL